jgi:glycosyltransferase involved in cell wall biosynthesis
LSRFPYLSIIIPARNEENRLPKTLDAVSGFLESQPYSFEILVVENGSNDRTADVAAIFARQHGHIRLLQESQAGKGNAVRAGMLAAEGRFRFMADADLSMPVDQIPRFLPPEQENADIVIGSREAPGSVRFNEPHYRHLGGRFINTMIRLFALPGLHDTQCGFKCFRGQVAEDLFAYQTLQGWSFDIEILYVARKRGYRIIELPIPWYYQTESKVKPVQDAIRMISDIFIIRRNARLGSYDRASG